MGKESACQCRKCMGLIPGSGRSPGEGHNNPLQYSCLGNPMDRGAWGTRVHGVTKESGMTERLNNNRQGTALGGAHALDHIVGASGGLLACGSNSQLCPEGHPALTPLAITCAIIRSNFSSRKYYSPVLPFFFFLLSLWRFVFICSLFILFQTYWLGK